MPDPQTDYEAITNPLDLAGWASVHASNLLAVAAAARQLTSHAGAGQFLTLRLVLEQAGYPLETEPPKRARRSRASKKRIDSDV